MMDCLKGCKIIKKAIELKALEQRNKMADRPLPPPTPSVLDYILKSFFPFESAQLADWVAAPYLFESF